ncbi:MAG: prepilin-type N-terminal cleavage/methylation domain-containing protein [Gammaproteobacteria bacterium]|nr:prepilin-type N-terminal cleavage/methylation domain-containing protein [Gammaproteobacteria bacterium]
MELRVARREQGFTLIELMVVVVIATILVSLAVPSYMNNVRQSRRTEAKTTLLDVAGREESYFSTNGSQYTPATASLGLNVANGAAFGSGYYTLTVCSPAGAACGGLAIPNPPAAPSYQVVATAIGSQVNDTQCLQFGVDSTGQQYATGTGGAVNTAYCWAN